MAVFRRRIEIPDAWADYNGHLNEGYYVVAFSQVSFELLEHLGIGESYLAARGASVFTGRNTIDYRAEVPTGRTVEISVDIAEVTDKKITFDYTMWRDGAAAATMRSLCLHVDTAAKRVTPFPDDIRANLEAAAAAQAESAAE